MESEPDYKRLFLEEQRRREEAEHRQEEAERRQEEAERRTQSTTLPEYLNAYHKLFQGLRVQDYYLSTKGDPFNAYGKPRPDKLCEWMDAPNQLERIWQQVLAPDVVERRLFSPLIAIEDHKHGYLRHAIGSELDLRIFQTFMIETPTASILEAFYQIPALRQRFRLKGRVQYESHANMLTLGASSHSESSSKRKEKSATREWGAADMFCVYNIDETNFQQLILIAEYKAPHKLDLNNIQLGLREMNLNQLTIADIDEDLTDAEKIIRICCQCVGALITQAFAYMISRGLRYGFVSTGEVFIFLHIKKRDPTTCYYFLSNPSNDVGDTAQDVTQENHLHLTALSQVLAFTLLAMKSDPEDLVWRDTALNRLSTWDLPTNMLIKQLVDLQKRCPNLDLSPDTTHRIANDLYAKKSPIRLIGTRRKRESPPSPTPRRHNKRFDDSDDDESGAGGWLGRQSSNVAVVIHQKSHRDLDPSPSQSSGSGRTDSDNRGRVSNRYCTHQCLLGLVRQQPLDLQCPNIEKHGLSHQIDAATLVQHLREQYAKSFAGLEELNINGAVGALYQATLLSHGYTMVAKATTTSRITYLEHEALIYKKLKSIQGHYIPVYIGAFNLERSLLYKSSCRITYMMLMSYGGVPIIRLPREVEPPNMSRYQEIWNILQKMGVDHNDFDGRNQLYDVESKQVMLIDFERSEFKEQETIQSNGSNKRRRSHQENNQDRTVLRKICWNQRPGQDYDKNSSLQ